MSWQRITGLGIEVLTSLVCLGLLLLPRPAPEAAPAPRVRHAGTLLAVLGAEEEAFGLWRGRDLTEGEGLKPRTRIALALDPSGADRVQLFARSDPGTLRAIPLSSSEGGLAQAPAPGHSLVYHQGTGALLVRVCPPDAPVLEIDTAAGVAEVEARFREALDAAALPRPRGREAGYPGWTTRLPDGAPVEVPWRWLSGAGCSHALIDLGPEEVQEPCEEGES
ncbi:MAG: hypothetical protein P1V51_24920 [Deltaproteobacteria bacterium]|nr:hypothetical protein [Deltaproteobacteria bacterium]